MSKKCIVCDSEMKFSHTDYNKKNDKLEVYVCTGSNGYPWECFECGFKFHLDESYPTSTLRRCPRCGDDTILNCHCNI